MDDLSEKVEQMKDRKFLKGDCLVVAYLVTRDTKRKDEIRPRLCEVAKRLTVQEFQEWFCIVYWNSFRRVKHFETVYEEIMREKRRRRFNLETPLPAQ